jgi:hypothetical protein
MFTVHPYSVPRQGRLRPVSLPWNVLLAIGAHGAYMSGYRQGAFNLAGALKRLLQGSGPDVPEGIARSFVFAPDLDDEQLAQFLTRPFSDGFAPHFSSPVSAMRAPFPGLALGHGGSQDFDIVHFAGYPYRFSIVGPYLAFDRGFTIRVGPGTLRDALLASRCRLLVIQDDFIPDGFAGLAEFVLQNGGPSIMRVDSKSPAAAESFFFRFYANLLHHQPLSQAGQGDFPEVMATLYLAEDGDTAFDISPFLGATRSRLQQLTSFWDAGGSLEEQLASFTNYGHSAQLRAAQERIDLATRLRADTQRNAEEALQQLNLLPPHPWDHEREGVIPLGQIAELAQTLEANQAASERLVEGLDRELQRANAPRVLNANFADAQGVLLAATDALVGERDYDLLVEIGPRWSEQPSLVSGASEFPIAALPPGHDGYRINVSFVSDDFSPPIVSGACWLPEQTGGSRPMIDGEPSATSAPLKLRLRAPALGGADAKRRLHGRLFLYYENNLLQSAQVAVTVARVADRNLDTPNEIVVDYLLTGAFRDVGALAVRYVEPTRPTSSAEQVGLSLTLNEDGSGSHRIVVREDGQTAYFNYDPLGANALLAEVRGELSNCYWQRNARGDIVHDSEGNPSLGLDRENGKGGDAFLWDLLKLAKLGSRLFGLLFTNVVPPAGQTAPQWIAALRTSLAESKVIQIARTGPAQYVFPWSLVYDHALTEPTQVEFCPVIQEWDETGRRRNRSPLSNCPHSHQAWHARDNLICPYGFWGLRHRVEQPPSLPHPEAEKAPSESSRRIRAQQSLSLGVALTGDASLDQAAIARHVGQLSAISRLTFAPPAAAQDWEAVRSMLRAPQIAYFLCHGEVDPTDGPYLGIGARDKEPRHRIYAQALSQFFVSASGIEPNEWARKTPLIFINGCHTTDLTPGQMLNFVAPFTQAGASGVIGTEISVLLPVAVEVAEMLIRSLAAGEPIADAIRAIRWNLIDRGNLLGLAYTPYCFADLRVAFEP